MIHTSNWNYKLMEKFVFSLFTENFNKITTKSMLYGSVIKVISQICSTQH
jgi:hypothetical protein